MKKGLFVSFEGGEGSGKTAQIEKIVRVLAGRKISFVTTLEPGNEVIRGFLKNPANKIEPLVEFALFTADRAMHMPYIRADLSAGNVVLCDRFADSSWVYQGWARELSIKHIEETNRAVVAGTWPDVTYLLQVDPEVGLARARCTLGVDSRFEEEELEFHFKVADGYDRLARLNPERIVVIDANKSDDEVFSDLMSDLLPRIEGRR